MTDVIGRLAPIAWEIAAVLLLAGLAGSWWRRRGGAAAARTVPPAAIVALIAAGIAVVDGVTAGQELRAAHRTATTSRRGLTYCFAETGVANRTGFVNWLRRELPAHATYALAFAPQPDEWCLTLALLPRVPQFGNDHPRWLVTWGVTPPDVQARIVRHDESVRIYAPGFALVRLG